MMQEVKVKAKPPEPVKVRLTREQYDALKFLASREGQGMAAWIRSRIHGELAKAIQEWRHQK